MMTSAKPRPWYHATYHGIISILGIGGLLPLPYSYAYLGWAGGTIVLLASTATSYWSGRLLVDCQDATRHRTYSPTRPSATPSWATAGRGGG
mmetsp:Transcript_31010/g.70063  ORF Transcript_31010/g.70063 Transcript_31010/m.70063 type:complete len:92 (+) Transcript_31010:95-370(+)